MIFYPTLVILLLVSVVSNVPTVTGGSVSKNPANKIDKAKLQMLQAYAPAKKANEDLDEDLSTPPCTVGEEIGGKCMVHPLVAVYMEEEIDTENNKGFDIHAATSFDNGGSWKRMNLSKKGERVQEYNGRKCTTSHDEEGEHTRRLDADGDGDQIAFEYVVNSFKPMLVVKNDMALIAWTSKNCRGGGYEPLAEADKYQVDGSQRCRDYTGEVEGLGQVPYSCVWTARGILDPENSIMVWTKGEQLTTGRRDAFQLFAAVSGDGKAWGLVWQEDPSGLRPGEQAGPGEGMSGATVSHKTDIWFSSLAGPDFKGYDFDETSSTRPVSDQRFTTPIRVTDNASCKVDPNFDSSDPENWIKGGDYCFEICAAPGGLTPPDTLDDKGLQTCIKNGNPLDGNTGASRPTMVILPGDDGQQVLIGYEETKGVGFGGDKGTERIDWGKNAFFHSFRFDMPDEVAHGTQLNLPELDENFEPIVVNGTLVYHNARRVRIIAQPLKSMGEHDLAAYLIWREGPEGHGQPAHIMGRRLLGGHLPRDLECKGIRDTEFGKICTGGVEDLNADQLPEVEGDLTDARAHRGFLRGDFLAILYTFTTKWGRGDGQPYDAYLRRSFDGGHKWRAFNNKPEGPKNLSNLRSGEADGNSGWSVMEPRLVATPGTINPKAPKSPSDVQNQMVFYVAYCTTHNPHSGEGERFLNEDDEGMPLSHETPKDIYWTYTDNYGETFKQVWNENAEKWQYPWLAKTSGAPAPGQPLPSFGAPQLKITPAGDKMFASYEGTVGQIELASDGAGPCSGNGQPGSDVCINGTVVEPFFDYDMNGDGAVFADDLEVWKKCCNGMGRGRGSCRREFFGICDLDGDGRLTGHDKHLLEEGIKTYFAANAFFPTTRRAKFLRGR